jgi:hypothetical protein
VQGGIEDHERDAQRVHDAVGVEQRHAGDLVQPGGGQGLMVQGGNLATQREQVVHEVRAALLALVHNSLLAPRPW